MLLEVSHISVAYAGELVLSDVSMSLGSGRICGVVGESGSGKSTLLAAILGILEGGHICGGRILFDGVELSTLSERQLRRVRGAEIGLVAQDPMGSFHPTRTIERQLRDMARSHGIKDWKALRGRALALMERFELKDAERVLSSYAFELSGGMAQRVSLAFAAAMRPKLLLADEPTSALDVVAQQQVVAELAHVRDKLGGAVLVVTHNMGVVSALADEVVIVYAGRVMEQGPAARVMSHPLHPYTQNLVAAIPRMGKPAPRGVVVTKQNRMLEGCPYQQACSRCDAACCAVVPRLIEVEPQHWVRCNAFEGNGDAR